MAEEHSITFSLTKTVKISLDVDTEGDVVLKADDTPVLWLLHEGMIMRNYSKYALGALGFQVNKEGQVKLSMEE